jgi:hypothetical protein
MYAQLFIQGEWAEYLDVLLVISFRKNRASLVFTRSGKADQTLNYPPPSKLYFKRQTTYFITKFIILSHYIFSLLYV